MYTEAQEKYKNFCESLPYVPIYQKPWWLDATAEPQHWSAVFAEKNGVVQAALPFMVKKKYGMTVLTQPPFTQFLGPLFNQQAQKEDTRLANEKKWTNALIDALPRHHIFMQSFAHSVTNWLPWYWRGFGQTTRYSYVIPDISDVENLMQKFEKRKKSHIINGINNFTVNFDLSAEDFYKYHKKVVEYRGYKLSYNFNLFKRIYAAIYSKRSGRILYLTDEHSEISAAKFFIWDQQSSYALIGASSRWQKQLGASSLIVLEVIKYLSSRVKKFDFEGSMIEPIEETYRKFGTHQTPYFSISRGSNIVISSLLHARDYWMRNK